MKEDQNESIKERCVVDFVAGMSDIYAMQAAKEILLPKEIRFKSLQTKEEGKLNASTY